MSLLICTADTIQMMQVIGRVASYDLCSREVSICTAESDEFTSTAGTSSRFKRIDIDQLIDLSNTFSLLYKGLGGTDGRVTVQNEGLSPTTFQNECGK